MKLLFPLEHISTHLRSFSPKKHLLRQAKHKNEIWYTSQEAVQNSYFRYARDRSWTDASSWIVRIQDTLKQKLTHGHNVEYVCDVLSLYRSKSIGLSSLMTDLSEGATVAFTLQQHSHISVTVGSILAPVLENGENFIFSKPSRRYMGLSMDRQPVTLVPRQSVMAIVSGRAAAMVCLTPPSSQWCVGPAYVDGA